MPDIINMLATLHGLDGNPITGDGTGAFAIPGLDTSPVATPGIGQANNVMQALGAAPPATPDPIATAPAPAMAPIATAPAPAMAPIAAPRQKHSLIDILGKVSDVLAKTGGAAAQYQPTLDANTARTNAADDRTRQINLDNLKLALTKNQLTVAAQTAGDSMKGKAIQAIQAIQEAHKDDPDGGTAAIAKAWPILAQNAGLSADDTAHIGGIVTGNDPAILDALDRQYNGIEEYDTAPQLAINRKTGATELVQVGKHGGKQVTTADEGFDFAPANVIAKDTGGETVNIDPRSGRVLSRIHNTVSPDTAANNSSRERITAAQDASRAEIAAARGAKPGAGATGPVASTANAMNLLSNIERGFDNLHSMKALPGDGGSVVGQVGNFLQRAVPGAGTLAEQAGGQAAQARVLMEKDINSLQSEMVKSLPASATRTKFEQEIQRRRLPDPNRMSYATGKAAIADLRSLYTQAQKDLAREQGASTAPPARRTILPAPAGVRTPRAPSVSNW